jgi:Tol biopolymer transport system component
VFPLKGEFFMYPFVMFRWLLVTLLLAVLTACSSTSIAPVATSTGGPTSIPAATATTQNTANPTVTVQINVSSLTGRIVFDNFEDIYVMNADGTNVQQLTNNPGPEFDPMWSPDGKRIVYRDSRRGPNQDDEIYLMNADGSGQTNLTNNPANDWGAAWSPDGTWIAFNSTRAGDIPQLFVMNADGSGVEQLTEQEAEYPAWSPDGSQIVFMSSIPDYEIYVMNADGSGLTRLTNAPGEDGWPAWSPDGKQIVFESARDDCSISNRPDCGRSGDIGPFFDLWIMNADGSGQTRLTQISGQFSAWSPDGRYIVFNSLGGLYVMRPDGSDITHLPISGVGGDLLFADWKP